MQRQTLALDIAISHTIIQIKSHLWLVWEYNYQLPRFEQMAPKPG